MDKPKAGGQRFAAWSAPRRGDFHTLERFGRITLTAAPPVPAVVPGTPVPGTAPTAAAPAEPTPAIAMPGRQPVAVPTIVDPTRLQVVRPSAAQAPAAH
jgi:hypothetical protein